jgi:magnesium-protoporphyrin O-methyltransferase
MSDTTATYARTRSRLEAYFDRTAAETWARLTSDAPVSRIRQTVRAGRDRMRAELLGCLPADLAGARVLDAGCGAGQMAVELASRGAEVVAVDIAPSLLAVAAERTPAELAPRIDYRAGDMADPAHGRFDFAIAMDSLIHYAPRDIAGALARLAANVEHRIAFTIAPRTPLLTAMHLAGKAFPRSDRSPAIRPVSAGAIARLVAAEPDLAGWTAHGGLRVSSGFYISQAMEITR